MPDVSADTVPNLPRVPPVPEPRVAEVPKPRHASRRSWPWGRLTGAGVLGVAVIGTVALASVATVGDVHHQVPPRVRPVTPGPSPDVVVPPSPVPYIAAPRQEARRGPHPRPVEQVAAPRPGRGVEHPASVPVTRVPPRESSPSVVSPPSATPSPTVEPATTPDASPSPSLTLP